MFAPSGASLDTPMIFAAALVGLQAVEYRKLYPPDQDNVE
jgi:hypothetical protein